MVKYDKFELYMVNALYDWGSKIQQENNRVEAEVFTELVQALYKYEKYKESGDIDY